MPEDCSTTATLVCGLSEFKADRVILSDVSHYFRSALNNGWLESTAGRVVLPTIHPKSMKFILECINTGQVKRVPKNKEDLEQLVEDADYLQFDDLVKLVFGLLTSQQLTMQNFRELYDLSQKLNNNQYCVSQVLRFLAENFSDLMKCPDFLLLTTVELKQVLQQKALRKYGTKLVLTGILVWIKFEEARVVYLEEFLNSLEEFGWCSACLNSCLKENTEKAWNCFILENLIAVLSARNHNEFVDQEIEAKGKLLVLGYTSSNQSVISMFDKKTNRWVGTRTLPFDLEDGMSVEAYGCHVYFFGGEKSVNNIHSDDYYDPVHYYEYNDDSENFQSTDPLNTEPEYDDHEHYYEYIQDEENGESDSKDQFYECVEHSDSADDQSVVEFYEYHDDRANVHYDYSYRPMSDRRLATMHNLKNGSSSSSRVATFILSLFGGDKIKDQNRECDTDANGFSSRVMMTIFHVFKNPWTVSKMISFFLSTFEDKNELESPSHETECEYGAELKDDHSATEYYENEDDEVDEMSKNDKNNEDCKIENDLESIGDIGDTNNEEYYNDVEISEEAVSYEDTPSELTEEEESDHKGSSVHDQEYEEPKEISEEWEYDEESEEYEEQSEEYEEQCEEYDKRCEELGKWCDECKEHCEELEKRYVQYEERCDELEKRCDEYEGECDEEYEEYEEGYEEEYDENDYAEYDEEYNGLFEELIPDDEDVVDVEYCRVYHNNIDEWNRVTVYCPLTNAVLQHEEDPLIFSVCLAGSGVLRDCIYIVNGVNEHYAMIKHVQCFKPSDHSCHLVASTNKAHCSPHVLPFEDCLYILGSCNRNDKVVERYDLLKDQWTVVTRLPRSIDMCLATICQKKLLILRKGFESYFHIYDLTTGTWLFRDYEGGPTKVEWLSCAQSSDKAVVLVYDMTSVMHQYDMELAEWVMESKQNLSLKNCLFTCSI